MVALGALIALWIVLGIVLGPREVEGPRIHYCDFCEARFRSARTFAHHMAAAHPNTWSDE